MIERVRCPECGIVAEYEVHSRTQFTRIYDVLEVGLTCPRQSGTEIDCDVLREATNRDFEAKYRD